MASARAKMQTGTRTPTRILVRWEVPFDAAGAFGLEVANAEGKLERELEVVAELDGSVDTAGTTVVAIAEMLPGRGSLYL